MITKDFCTETKIVGVTKNNDRGIPIQSLLPSLKEGDRLILIRDYGNQYDENAIKVYASMGERLQHIGYISASLAENISPFLEENPKYDIEGVVHRITGGVDEKSFGCNITIWIQDPDEPSYEEIHAFAKHISNTNNEDLNSVHNSAPISQKNHKHTMLYFNLAFITSCLAIVFIALSVISLMFVFKGNTNNESLYFNEESNTMAQNELNSYYDKGYVGQSGAKTSSDNTSFYTPSKSDNSQKVSSSVATSSSIFSASEDEIPVKISDISFDLNILPPNSIGTVWLEATYTNKSNYTITSVSLTFLCKDTNEKHYLSNFDTILPRETSPKFDTFGPESEKESDIEFLECGYVVMVNGDRKHVIYDYKLNSYKMY